MKNFLMALLLAGTVFFAGLYVHQNEKTRKAEGDVAGLQKNVAELETRLKQQEETASGLRERLHDTRAEVLVQASEAATLQGALTQHAEADASASTNSLKNALSSMFKNPEMREMIKNQQKAVMGMMIDKNFADFFAALNLTPEQSAALKEMLTKKTLVDAGSAIDLMAGDMDAARRAEITQQAKAEKAAIDEELKQFLGNENFTEYQAYEKTIPERMAMGQFKDQLAAGTSALHAEQEQQLMKAMGEERSNFKFTTDYQDQSKFDGDMASAFTEEKMNQFFSEQEQLSQRYLNRAQTILSAEQLAAYQKFLVNQREMMKTGMKMAASMFAPKSGK